MKCKKTAWAHCRRDINYPANRGEVNVTLESTLKLTSPRFSGEITLLQRRTLRRDTPLNSGQGLHGWTSFNVFLRGIPAFIIPIHAGRPRRHKYQSVTGTHRSVMQSQYKQRPAGAANHMTRVRHGYHQPSIVMYRPRRWPFINYIKNEEHLF